MVGFREPEPGEHRGPWQRSSEVVREIAAAGLDERVDQLADLRPDRWRIGTVLDRLATVGDPFRALLAIDQVLPEL